MACPFQTCADSNIYEAHINHIKICAKGPESKCPFCKEHFARMKFDDHLENCVERYKELVKKAEYMMTKLRIENLHLREKLANAERRAQVNTPNFQNYHLLE
ncbi:unnamed protein product [Oikopleura dioica]|uniref:Uncharacterized protein n=1 Tax=Oikopleura dioica TaxID=34765 RepID=E4Z0W1_OIKDI|nr:unnamed protein product [Oikopleura dioica]